jgi:hypothetical protein
MSNIQILRENSLISINSELIVIQYSTNKCEQ